MAEQFDKSDSDSREAQGTYLDKLKSPEHTDPKKIAANKLILNDFRQYPELWDVKHKAHGMLQSIHLAAMLEKRHNLKSGELQKKWKKISKYYEELLKMGKLPLSNSDFPYNQNEIIQYPYMKEMSFYEPIVQRLIEAGKPWKRKHCDDEPTHSKKEVHSAPALVHLGEDSSSQSVSLETEPSSHLDTDSQASSKLFSEHDIDSLGSPQIKPLLVNSDRGTQTSSSSRISGDTDSRIVKSAISVRRELDQNIQKQFDEDLAKLVKIYERRPSSSEDSSAAQ